MMSRIEAERQITQRVILLSAEGRQLKDADTRRLVAELEEQKDGRGRLVKKAGFNEIAQLGIKVKRVPAAISTPSTSTTGGRRKALASQ